MSISYLDFKNSFSPWSGGFWKKRGGMNKIKVVYIVHVHMCEDAICLNPTSPYYGPPYEGVFNTKYT